MPPQLEESARHMAEQTIHKRISGLYKRALAEGDVTLLTGAIEQKADFFMLDSTSPFFRKALSPPFVESKTRSIKFDSFNPWTIWRFIYYVYHGHCDINHQASKGSEDKVTKETEAVAKQDPEAADHPEHRTRLQAPSQDCFGPDLGWGYLLIELYRLADLLDISELKTFVIDKFNTYRLCIDTNLDDWLGRVRSLYNDTAERDNELRSLVVAKFLPNMNLLRKNQAFIAFTRESCMIEFVSDLTFQVVEYALDVADDRGSFHEKLQKLRKTRKAGN